MLRITQYANINLVPGAIPPRINVSQYDDDSRTLSLALYDGAVSYTPGSNTTAQIQGTKPDGKGFQYDATIEQNKVIFYITQQMTAVAGDVLCEVVIKNSTMTIATGNFILAVEKAALGEDTDISETVLPDIIDAAESNAERAEAAAAAAESASLHPPYIGANDNWFTFDTVTEQYVDSGVDARGDDGEDGTSIANITKTGSAGLVDTYTVTLTDGTTYTFTVTNGANGTDGQDGQDGADGEDGVGIADIEKTSTVGLVDTYTITLTDQTTYTFTVTNGTSALPSGGTTGQVLTKNSDTSGDASWQTPASGSSSLADLTDTTITSPTDGQVLKFSSSGGAHWYNAKDAGVMSFNTDTTDTTGYLLNIASGMYSILDIRKGDTVAFALKANYTFSSAGGQDVQSWGLHFSEGGSTFTHYNNFICNTSTSNTYFTKDLKKGDVIVALCLGLLGDNPIMQVVSVYNIDEILPTANGGTGNADGYIRTGHKANTTIGTGATIEGTSNEASANYTHAEGYNTKASGNNAHAEGTSTQATGTNAHAEGSGSKATGTASHAENTSNTASGHNSHAGGNNSTAGGAYSFVHGRDISIGTNGQYAAGFGQGTVSNYNHQFVAGKYNNNKSTSIFEVGIGTGTNARSNGLELDTSGNLKTAGTITNGKGVTVGDAEVLLPSTVGWTGKNELDIPSTIPTISGLTITTDANKCLKINGTAGGSDAIIWNGGYTLHLAAGTYRIVVSADKTMPAGSFNIKNSSETSVASMNPATETTKEFTLASAADVRAYLNVNSGNVYNDITVGFMIMDARITDATYEPYHKSVEECLEEINDKLSYLETTATLSTSAATTVTFTSAKLTTSSCVEVGVSEWGLVPDDVTVSTGSCTVTLPKVDSAHTVTVRLYVR